MVPDADHERMTGIVLIVLLLAIGPLAVFFGADSKLPKDRRSI